MNIMLLALFGATFLGLVASECPDKTEGLQKWSDTATWAMGKLPADGEFVTINKRILLDTETARLNGVVIEAGGKLVFDPEAALAKITTRHIDINADGYLDIGSADCPFEGEAEILLTGNRDDDDNNEDEDFGEKFIGVREGGSLEIHGKVKKSWTRLDQTLQPSVHIFTVEDDQPPQNGLLVYQFDRATGEEIPHSRSTLITARHVNAYLDELSDSKSTVNVIFNRGVPPGSIKLPKYLDQLDQIVAELENKLLKGAGSLAKLKTEAKDVNDAWVLVVDRDVENQVITFKEVIDVVKDNDDVETETEKIEWQIGDWFYSIQSKLNSELYQSSWVTMDVLEPGYDQHTILVSDDVSSWNAGDRIVIASTDYDFNQVEEAEVVKIDGKKVDIKGKINYQHYGEIYEGVDMRAEVGVLTRNVLIHGEMSNQCIGGNLNDCQDVHKDTFGGNTKAIKGFKAYNIEGAEVTNMGQGEHLGRYPIHFHMAEDVDQAGSNPVIANNSIHHCHSRCITVHGTHGVHVLDNIAHDTIGHCFFVEDGGEKRTVFDGNLGLTTRVGKLIPSDSHPSTFWITSPLTTFVNNVAAGSALKTGVGIWFLFPNQPTSQSKGMGFFALKEAKSTKITLWENNRAHSNGQIGFALFRRLREDHGILGCQTYNPLLDPLDKNSDLIPVIFDGFIGYKNREANAMIRATTVEMHNFVLAESQTGLKLRRNMLNGYQLVKNAKIVGETPNTGHGGYIKVFNETKNKKELVWSDVSYPDNKMPHLDMVGVYIDAEGPLHIQDATFKGFEHNELRKACAIKFQDEFRFGMGVSSGVKGLVFEDELTDGEDYNRVCHDNKVYGGEETSMMLHDYDGSLTGTEGLSVVADDEFMTIGAECTTNSAWNMRMCKGKFAKFYVFPKSEFPGATFITSADKPDDTNERRLIGYTLSENRHFVLNWNIEMPKKIVVRATGLDGGRFIRVGFCLPLGATNLEVGEFLDASLIDTWKDHSDIVEADSVDDLDNDDTQTKKIFFDRTKSILYVKFLEKAERTEADLADCIGDLNLSKSCPFMTINFSKVLDKVDLSQGDCTGR